MKKRCQCSKVLDNGNMLIEMPVKIVPQAGRNRILSEDVHYLENCDSPLVINLARAFHWQDLIDDGKFSNIEQLKKDCFRKCCVNMPIEWKEQEKLFLW